MTEIRRFQPDLIVEATSTCDRHCPGCYAPNAITSQNALQLFAEKPYLFLSMGTLEKALQSLSTEADLSTRTISVRGGEPTRHPRLFELLRTLRARTKGLIYLETHGRWVSSAEDNTSLLDAIAETTTIVKISFDQMHGLASAALREITTSLDQRGVSWCLAITESTDADFARARSQCNWATNDQIFFQEKARTSDELVRPTIASISVEGRISASVSVRTDFGATTPPRTEQVMIRAGAQL